MTNAAVGSMSDWSGVLKDLFRQIDDGSMTLEMMKAINNHLVVYPVQDLISHTAQLLSKKFGKRIEVDPLPSEFTLDNLAKWAEFNLQPVFLPNEEIGQDRQLKDWIKLEMWFYDKIRDGKIAPDSAQLQGGWYLADFTVGTDYIDGTQVFKDDPLASIIAQLRQKGKIGKYDNTPEGSRFAITHNEWQTRVLPAVAEALGFNPDQVRLERAVESNAIGNLYDPNRGQFNMWESFYGTLDDSPRLDGGYQEYGVLVGVFYRLSDFRYISFAGRPLVSFV